MRHFSATGANPSRRNHYGLLEPGSSGDFDETPCSEECNDQRPLISAFFGKTTPMVDLRKGTNVCAKFWLSLWICPSFISRAAKSRCQSGIARRLHARKALRWAALIGTNPVRSLVSKWRSLSRHKPKNHHEDFFALQCA